MYPAFQPGIGCKRRTFAEARIVLADFAALLCPAHPLPIQSVQNRLQAAVPADKVAAGRLSYAQLEQTAKPCRFRHIGR